jgi:hypothetical protein
MRFNKGAKSEKRRALRQEACTHALLTLRQEARTCHAKVGDTFYVSLSQSFSVWLYVSLYVSPPVLDTLLVNNRKVGVACMCYSIFKDVCSCGFKGVRSCGF